MTEKRYLFSRKLIISISAFFLLLNVLLGVLLMHHSIVALRQQIHDRMLDISKSAAALLDGDEFERLQKDDKDTEPYQRALTILRTFHEQVELDYIYGIRDMKDGTFVFTIDPEPVAPGEFGSPVVYTDALYAASLGIPTVDDKPYKDEWGRFYSAYSPIFNSEGRVAGIVAADFNAIWYEKQVHQHVYIIIFVCFLSLLGGAGIVLLVTENLRKRFALLNIEMKSMTGEVEELAEELRLRTGLMENKSSVLQENGKGKILHTLSDDGFEELDSRLQFVRKELRDYIDKAHKIAFTDGLTGIGNRNAYLDAIKNQNSKLADGTADFAIAIFDINGLKNANDELGHECGDMLIVATADILKAVFEPECIFRIGGDEFVALMEKVSEQEMESRLAQVSRMVDGRIISKNDRQVQLAVSKGFSVSLKCEDYDVKTVFRRADDAMYEDKSAYYANHADRRRKR